MPKPRAFTLIELLVVVSIIALLIAILLPALSAARQSAVVIQCASNNKQLAIAATAFATENKGLFAARDTNTSKVANAWKQGTTDRWAEDWLTFMEGTYENLPALVLCPNTNNQGETWESTVKPNWAISDYAYYPTYYERIAEYANSDPAHWVAENDYGETIKSAKGLEDPSDSPLLGDSLYSANDIWTISAHPAGHDKGVSNFVATATGQAALPTTEPFGGNQANLDGSVSWYDFSQYEVAAQDFFGSSPKTYWVEPAK